MKFALMLTSNGAVLAEADTPEALRFDAAYPYERWHVNVRWSAPDGLSCGVRLVARVDLRGAKDYRKAADHSVRVVREWLSAGHATNDFDGLADGPVIDIIFKGSNDAH